MKNTLTHTLQPYTETIRLPKVEATQAERLSVELKMDYDDNGYSKKYRSLDSRCWLRFQNAIR